MSAEGDKDKGNSGGQKSTFGQVVKAVAWSFLGVRKRRDLEADAAQLNPLHLIIAGVIGAAIFIGVLIFVVHLVVG
ncbi:DUF2970 domain-containing protein [Paraburkholderia kururiensis]|uniref:DUF2970 domain-containing protein n=1 Tax=Paraburkholderia kururiensis TaxID=984307 RepID=A0ABZ0WGN4_9BURK|nr:DUF2970 domain-containing protein [Paraburkholderia kururiensis]WQD76513.1 DUF2970 domain-containing protein [Paraburkholderia kururiensis]